MLQLLSKVIVQVAQYLCKPINSTDIVQIKNPESYVTEERKE